MFPCFSNNGNDPISYNDQEAYDRPFYIDTIISNSKQQELPLLSFTHFPSPYGLELEDNVFLQQNLDVLLHQLQPLRATGATNLSQPAVNMVISNQDDVAELTETSNKKSDKPIIPTKRPSKKDRHSKIDTAQGPRDRRMRLSLKVARGFFDLQDKLGFDKASKTVEWLLTQAKDEIKKLTSSFPQMNSSSSVATKSASSTSEGEVLSKFKEASIEGSTSKGKHSPCARKERKTSKPQPRKTTFAPLAKESRKEKRARARERTRERWSQRIQGYKLSDQNHNLNQSGYWTSSTLEIGEVFGSQTHDMNPTSFDGLQEQFDTPEVIIDENFEIMGSWAPSFSNHLNNPAIPQDVNQFTDFQALYYNINGMR